MIHFRLRFERLRDRLRLVARCAALARAALLGVVVAGAGAVGAALDPDGPWSRWPWAATAAVLAAAVVLDRRTRRAPIDAMLDRRLALDDLIVTAVEVDRRGARNPLELRLLDDAASTLARLGGERAVSWRPVALELEQLAGSALLAVGLVLVAHARGAPALPPRLAPVPGILGGGLGARPGVEGEGANPGGSGPSDAQRAMAAALADQAAAGAAADALRRGDAEGAARALRALADDAPRLSEGGREGLEQALAEASERVAPLDPELARDLGAAARDVASPDAERGARGLEALAARVESRPGRAAATPALAEADDGGPLERLAGGDDALGLERAAGGRSSLGEPARAPGAASPDGAGAPAAGSGADAAAPPRGDPDALRRAERDLVRRYFARQADGATGAAPPAGAP